MQYHYPKDTSEVVANWHPNLKDKPNPARNLYEGRMMKAGRGLPAQCAALGVEVINANPTSKMEEKDWWPIMDREAAVKLFD